MKAFPILLDTRPPYLGGAGTGASVLLAPLGPSSVLAYLQARLGSAAHSAVTVVTDFEPEADYERRLREAGVRVEAVVPHRELQARLVEYEPSDWLIILDPRCVPAIMPPPAALLQETEAGPRCVRHLVALEAHSGGTTERVQLGANGTVGRIQRYYDSSTWPFTSGVACSLLPASCAVGSGEVSLRSLRDLRRGLAERGVPSRDVFLRGGAFDLSHQAQLLALSEQVLLDHFARRPGAQGRRPEIGHGCEVDASARLIGPVILHESASLGSGAMVVGPAVIGARARIDRDAMVAQCVVGADAVVAAGVTLCHRVVFGSVTEGGAGATPPPAGEAPEEPDTETPEVRDEGPSTAGLYRFLKAAFDVTTSLVGLVLLSPLLLLIAALVKLESKGPVLYGDRREGKGGRVFECLKFRTMCAGADALQRDLYARNQVDGPQFKMAQDPRVTRVGRVLRTLNLDELPQLLNVLRLEMSLVGPRPSPFRENQLCVPWRDGRLSVRPGITGLWQICRNRRGQGDFHQWIHFDLLYVRHMSFVVDMKILAATLMSLAAQWPVPLHWIVAAGEPEPIPLAVPAAEPSTVPAFVTRDARSAALALPRPGERM
jgi:lipopolysaccharide/colanic/teichoic acid biosynthesis glycosyltransferase